MAIVRRVGVLSLGKMLGCLYALLGLIFGAFFSLLSLAGAFASSQNTQSAIPILFGAGAIIVLPIFYGLAGFIGGIIVAALYNLIAGIAGGVEVELVQPRQGGFPVAGNE